MYSNLNPAALSCQKKLKDLKLMSSELREEVEEPGNYVILKVIFGCSSKPVLLQFSFSALRKTFFGVLTAVARSSM